MATCLTGPRLKGFEQTAKKSVSNFPGWRLQRTSGRCTRMDANAEERVVDTGCESRPLGFPSLLPRMWDWLGPLLAGQSAADQHFGRAKAISLTAHVSCRSREKLPSQGMDVPFNNPCALCMLISLFDLTLTVAMAL